MTGQRDVADRRVGGDRLPGCSDRPLLAAERLGTAGGDAGRIDPVEKLSEQGERLFGHIVVVRTSRGREEPAVPQVGTWGRERGAVRQVGVVTPGAGQQAIVDLDDGARVAMRTGVLEALLVPRTREVGRGGVEDRLHATDTPTEASVNRDDEHAEAGASNGTRQGNTEPDVASTAMIDALASREPAQDRAVVHLSGGRDGDAIVLEGTEIDGTRCRWEFSEITPDTFLWSGYEAMDPTVERPLVQQMHARRTR